MIELQHVSRWYGLVIGLNDVTTQIGGGITALVGQNGAGKSTLIRLISGQIRPTTGNIRVFGHDPFANPEVYRLLGYCPEIDQFYERWSGRQFVIHMARLQGFSAQEAKERSDHALTTVGMIDRCDLKIGGYSKGMRQRIKLAQAIVHEPKIILLDEPLNGLDPVGRHEFMQTLNDLAQRGVAVMISSHILHEVEQLTSTILVLHRGRLLASGNLKEIRSLIDRHPHLIRIETSDPRKVAASLMALEGVVGAQLSDDAVELEVRQPDRFYASLSSVALEQDLPIDGFSSPDNNMEAVFRYLVEA